MAEYTPSEARVCIDYCNAVVARRRPDDEGEGMAEADAEFDRFLARVRRDAAREAVHGMAARFQYKGWADALLPVELHQRPTRTAQKVTDWMRADISTHYPETEDHT